MNYVRIISFVTLLGILLLACNKTPSVQRFIAENETKSGFTSITIPGNTLLEDSLVKASNSQTVGEAVNTVQILVYDRNSDGEGENFNKYVDQLTEVLNGAGQYEILFEMIQNGRQMSVRSMKSEGDIKELIGIVIDDDRFILGRLTGSMNPESMMEIARGMDFEKIADSRAFEAIIKPENTDSVDGF